MVTLACDGFLACVMGFIETPHHHALIYIVLFLKLNEIISYMYKLDLQLHSLPDSLNKGLRTNRYKYQIKNQKWDMLILGMSRGRLPPKPLEKAHIKIVRHFWRKLDYDGLVGSMKPVVDALVTAGVMIDDNYDVTGPWDVTQEFRSKKDGPLLVITISER